MEWREQSAVSCDQAYLEAQRWIEAVTKKTFGSDDFRSALENGVLLCDLINKIRPGIIKKVNRLPTPIAWLDNINVFLKACVKLGLKEAQLFHPGDLQDLSSRVTVKHQETNRRLKNVLITIYWLGRRAHYEHHYNGPYLNFKAFEGLLGTALYKALQDLSGQKGSNVRDSGFGDNWYSEQEELYQLKEGGGGHRRDDSLDSLDSLGSQAYSGSSDVTLKGSSEGCCSDTEADSGFRMADSKDSLSYRRSVVITPKVSTQYNQFLPSKDKASGYVPAPLRKKRAERNEDSRRSWANPMYAEDEGKLTRSKSTSDIQVEPSVVRQVSMSELLRHREQIKQSEDQWQDDLSKWKNRRRSVNSDIVKKKEEREKIEQMTYGSNTKSKTFKEMQEEREIKRQSSVGSRLGSRFSHLDEDVFEKPVTSPRSRAPPARSYTIDTPYHASELPEPSKKEDKSPAAPLGRSRAAPPPTSDISDHPPTSTGSVHKQPQRTLMEPKPPAVSRVSASLPRTYQASDSARLTSVVTPRPFGAQPSRITSLPRTFAMDESKRRVNGDSDVSKNSSVPNRYHQFMTSEDEAHSQSSSAHSSEDEEEQEETAGKNVLSAQSISPGPPRAEKEASVPPAPVQTTGQESSCQMRISLNQRPNSSRDFGFQATWDSTGAHVTSIQEGSPAEMFRLQTGDEVLTVNGHQVAKMSYTDWKAHMAEALLEGSLVMDIRRHGKNSFQDSKASLDLTSHVSMETPPSLKAPAHPVTDMTSNGVNGGFREESVTMRSKDSEPISLKNLKRRSEFFETGGSESAMPDIPVPSIAPSTSRWSWDPEEERRRQEKWLREQERLLQEKYKRDQEKLQEEWLKAQQEIAKSPDHQELEVNNNHRSLSLLSTINQSAPTLWEEEEKKREEEEQQKQRQQQEEEERRMLEEEELRWQKKREEEQRRRQAELEQQRLREEEEERKRQAEMEEQRRREQERRRRQEEMVEQRRREEEMEEQRRRQRALEEQQQWEKSKSSPQLDEQEKPQRKASVGGAGDKKGQPSLTQAETERQQIINEMKKKNQLLTDSSWIRQRSASTAVSKEEDTPPMRRGDSLDNLDTFGNSWRSSWTPRSNQNYSRSHSALSGSTSFYGGWSGVRSNSSTLPSSSSAGSLRGRAGTPSSPWSRQSSSLSPSSLSPTTSPEPASDPGEPQQRSRSVSGKKICTFCDTPLGKGAAMIIESLGLCYHLNCFKCIDCKTTLGGSEAGAEVRIRNKQLYCNSCYMRFKTGQPTSM